MKLSELLAGLGADLEEAASAAIEEGTRAHLRATVGRGVDPYGKPWPSSSEGGQALAGAADAVQIRVLRGRAVLLTIAPPWVYQHFGAGGSSGESADARRALAGRARRRKASGTTNKFHAPARKILPDEGMPPALEAAITKAFQKRVSA